MSAGEMIAILRVLVSLASIYACWWALTALRFDRFVREPGSMPSKLLHLVLAVVLGRQFAGFLIDYLDWTMFR